MNPVYETKIKAQGASDAKAFENQECYARGFSAGADFLYNNMWIPCKVKLPAKSGRYYTINLDSAYPDIPDVSCFDADTKEWYTDICNMRVIRECSHWMPVPPLPERL